MTTRSKQWYTNNNRSSKRCANSCMGTSPRASTVRVLRSHRNGLANDQAWSREAVGRGEDFPFGRRGPVHAASCCSTTIGQLVLFSTETGDAWLLDPSDQLAAPLARDGDPLSVEIEETDASFTVAWKGR